ncbi:14973_t:CDS:2, partial [Gigaspora rosea]
MPLNKRDLVQGFPSDANLSYFSIEVKHSVLFACAGVWIHTTPNSEVIFTTITLNNLFYCLRIDEPYLSMDSSPPPPGSAQEPTPLSDAEKIRLKRLAKLQQGSSNTSGETSQPTASSSKTVPTRPNSLPKTPTQEKPASPIKKPSTPVNQELPEKTPPKITPPTKSFEDWQNDIISRVLQITLDKSTAEKSENRLIYLDSVVKTLMEENPGMVSFKLSKSVLDSALFARLSIDPNQMSDSDQPPQIPLFDYLLDSWKRASEIKRSTRASK